MNYPKFEVEINNEGQTLKLVAVKISNSFLIYQDGKARAAIQKLNNNWEQFLLRPLSENFFKEVVNHLNKLESN